MRTIIAGSRTITDRHIVEYSIDHCPWEITVVLSGCAMGVDSIAATIARERGIPVEPYPYPAGYGRAGGPIRNAEMASKADALLLIWDGKSGGSANMLQQAAQRGLRIFEFQYAPTGE